MNKSKIEATDTSWMTLYTIGGVAAVLSVALIPVSIAAYFVWPLFPGDASVIFTLIQSDRLTGVMSLDFLYLLGNVFAIPIFLALYATLKRASESLSAIALALGLIGLVSLFPARPIVEMLSLSDQYANATTEIQRVQLLAAGDAMLALFHGTAFQAHYILGSMSLLISSLLMLRSSTYNKMTAYMGIIANVLVFGLFVPTIGVYLSLLSVFPFLTIWFVLLARRLFRLGRSS